MNRRKLNGDHNQCAGCGEFFNSSFAFDKHRVGDHGKDRRCLTPAEMLEIGMAVSSTQWWVSSLREDASRNSDANAWEPSNG